VPEDERLAIERDLREFDRLGEDLRVIERDLARSTLADEGVERLMTIPGVDMVVALAMTAAIGDVARLDKPISLSAISVSTRASASRDRGRCHGRMRLGTHKAGLPDRRSGRSRKLD
jgi:transposase